MPCQCTPARAHREIPAIRRAIPAFRRKATARSRTAPAYDRRTRGPLPNQISRPHSGGIRKRQRAEAHAGTGALVALGVGAVIGAGIFTLTGVVAAMYTGPAPGDLLRADRDRLFAGGAVLQRVRDHDPGGGQRVHLCVRELRRTVGVDHRLGPDSGILGGRGHGGDRMVADAERAAGELRDSTAGAASRHRHFRAWAAG